KNHTYQQLKDELDKLRARVSLSGSAGTLIVTLECKRENLQAVLKLIAEVLREPTFPQSEFDILKRQRKETLEKGLVEPMQLAIQALSRKHKPHPKDAVRYLPTIPDATERRHVLTMYEI